MISSDVIIVGGGPAGSSCAWKLRQGGREVLLLDRKSFPRLKPCAGWITPRVLRALELTESTYPLGLRPIRRLYFHFPAMTVPLPTHQYAIRRFEFDAWLLNRSGVPVERHDVRQIRAEAGQYIIDDTYRCRLLVGAGGTACPVYRTFFRDLHPRPENALITALEAEFPEEVGDSRPRLWFGEGGLPGYSWFVPKEGGYVNIGVGAFSTGLKSRRESIREHWERFLERLNQEGLLKSPRPEFQGHTYYLRTNDGHVQRDGCYILGDAAGLATRDMGEGIGPAVQSGILAAEAIIRRRQYSVSSISRKSFFDLLFPHRR